MADVFCNNCGHRNSGDANFCSSCGESLARSGAEPATVTIQLDQIPTGETQIPLAEPDDAVLIATRGPNAGSRFSLRDDVTDIGRHPESDIFLDDVTVSRRHVEIRRDSDGHTAEDVGSLNGTYLNRRRIESPTLLSNGDEIQVGLFRLVFVTGSEA